MYPRAVVNSAPEKADITDDDVDRVIDLVTTRLARDRWWITKDDLLSEAWLACHTTNVLSGATSTAAFHERLRLRLFDGLKSEDKWQRERTLPGAVTDVGEDGSVMGVIGDGAGGEISAQIGCLDARGSVVPQGEDRGSDSPASKVGRSRLLDRLSEMGRTEFVDWAEDQFGRRYAKKRDVRALLTGSSREQDELWAKYARGKRVIGGARIVVEGEAPTAEDHQETLLEEWRARYRWEGDSRASKINAPAVVMSADGETLVAPRMLRQPLR